MLWQPQGCSSGRGCSAAQLRGNYWLMLAESHLTRRLFGAMVGRIESLPLPAG